MLPFSNSKLCFTKFLIKTIKVSQVTKLGGSTPSDKINYKSQAKITSPRKLEVIPMSYIYTYNRCLLSTYNLSGK